MFNDCSQHYSPRSRYQFSGLHARVPTLNQGPAAVAWGFAPLILRLALKVDTLHDGQSVKSSICGRNQIESRTSRESSVGRNTTETGEGLAEPRTAPHLGTQPRTLKGWTASAASCTILRRYVENGVERTTEREDWPIGRVRSLSHHQSEAPT